MRVTLYNFIKPILFSLDPELAHDLVIKQISKFPSLGKLMQASSFANLETQVGGLTWKTPIGLAAGLDKNASAINFFSNLGFGAVEVGTVTPLAQAGNPKPRMFRYKEENSLRNCMGFNNSGIDHFLKNFNQHRSLPPVGINIGKNKATDDELAYTDYVKLYDKVKSIADYIVINVSSPNTPGLREHQTKDGLEQILSQIRRSENDPDLYVKISPDMSFDSIPDVIETISKHNVTGVIATNTTIREDLGPGGISGDLLYAKADQMRRKCLSVTKSNGIEFIGVGGFSRYEQVRDYWKAGGRAIQIYTAFIYQGPQILSSIYGGIQEDFIKFGVKNMDELYQALEREKE